jgi:hypothetical protein
MKTIMMVDNGAFSPLPPLHVVNTLDQHLDVSVSHFSEKSKKKTKKTKERTVGLVTKTSNKNTMKKACLAVAGAAEVTTTSEIICFRFERRTRRMLMLPKSF